MNAQQQLIQHLEQQIVELHQKLEKEKDDHEQTKNQISFEQSLVQKLSTMVPDLESTISTFRNENNELKRKLQKEAESKKKLEGKVIRRNQKILKLEEEKKALEEKDQELSEQLQDSAAELHQAKQEIELLQKTIARRDATIRTTKEVVSGVIAKQEADTESHTLNMVMKLSEAEHTALVKDTEMKILKDMMATIMW